MRTSLIVGILLLVTGVPARPAMAVQDASLMLTADEAVRLYLGRNLGIEAARLEVERAAADRIGARLRPNPELSVTAENFNLGGPVPFDRIYELGISYSETIELGGKRRLRSAAADLAVESAEAELADTLRRGVAQVERLYWETVFAQDRVRIAAEVRDSFQRLLDYSQVRFDAGAIAEADLIKVRLERVRQDAALRDAELDLRHKAIGLAERIGEREFESRQVNGELVFTPVELDLSTLRSRALESRPDLRAARLRVEQAGTSIALERSRNSPDLEPFAGYKRVASSNTVIFGIRLPLNFRDRNPDGIARATSQRRIAEAELGALESRAQAEVDVAYASYLAAVAQIEIYQDALIGPSAEVRDIALVSYEEGATDLAPLLEAERALAEVRYGYFETLLDYQVSLIDLELAVGTEIQQ